MKTSRCKRFVEKTAREGGKKKALGQLPGASDTALAYRRLQTVFVKEIKSQIVNIQAVNTHILDQPVKTFHIVIMPTGNAGCNNGRILQLRNKPCPYIVLVIVLL